MGARVTGLCWYEYIAFKSLEAHFWQRPIWSVCALKHPVGLVCLLVWRCGVAGGLAVVCLSICPLCFMNSAYVVRSRGRALALLLYST